MTDGNKPTDAPRWWDQTVTITRGEMIIGISTWCMLDFLTALWRHL